MSEAALDLIASLVLEDGRRWGEAATPVQWADARAVLDPEGPAYHFLTRARGYSKTTDLAAVAIAALLCQLPVGTRSYGVAADQDQGRLLLDSLEGFARRTPGLGDAFTFGTFKATAVRGGSLDILAADAAGAWGLRPALVVVDELAQWETSPRPRKIFDAVATAVGKVRGARLAIISTAGDPTHWSAKVLAHARADPMWRVHEVPGAPPWMDPARLEEQRRRLPESLFRRLFLNEWTAAEDRLVRPEDLAACVVLDGPLPPRPGVTYRIGVDLGLRQDRTVIAVAHAEPAEQGRRVVLDRMIVFAGTRANEVRLADVEAAIVEAATAYRAPVVCDPWQAVGLMQRLRARPGIHVTEYPFSAGSVGRLASTLHLLLRDRLLALPDDPELLDELAAVRLRETSPGVLRMDHDPDRHDDRAIALALAAQDLAGQAEPSPARTSVGQLVGRSLPLAGEWVPPAVGGRRR